MEQRPPLARWIVDEVASYRGAVVWRPPAGTPEDHQPPLDIPTANAVERTRRLLAWLWWTVGMELSVEGMCRLDAVAVGSLDETVHGLHIVDHDGVAVVFLDRAITQALLTAYRLGPAMTDGDAVAAVYAFYVALHEMVEALASDLGRGKAADVGLLKRRGASGTALHEAVVDSIARQHTPRLMVESGFAELDPRLGSLRPIAMGMYPLYVELLGGMADRVAQLRAPLVPASSEAIVDHLLRQGAGERTLGELARLLGLAAGPQERRVALSLFDPFASMTALHRDVFAMFAPLLREYGQAVATAIMTGDPPSPVVAAVPIHIVHAQSLREADAGRFRGDRSVLLARAHERSGIE